MADEIATLQELEMEALVSSFEDLSSQTQGQDNTRHDETDPSWNINHVPMNANQSFENTYGSDDEDYDSLFMGVIQEEQRQASIQHQDPPGDVEMDMS